MKNPSKTGKKNAPAAAPTSAPAHPAPQQKRSRRTEDKLLSAAVQVLDREGLDRATVPRIAAEAKLAPASIYRRFADKDDLLRAAVLRMLESLHTANADGMLTQLVGSSLGETVEAVIAALLRQFRGHPQLLRALNRTIEADPASPFVKEIARRLSINFGPDPERAARFALFSATGAIEMAALDPSSLWQVALPLSEKAFAAELARQMLAYLRRKP